MLKRIEFIFCLNILILTSKPLADLGGAAGARPPTGSNSFIFTYIFAKKYPHRRLAPPNSLVPPQREILDPPLQTFLNTRNYFVNVESLRVLGSFWLIWFINQRALYNHALCIIGVIDIQIEIVSLEFRNIPHIAWSIAIHELRKLQMKRNLQLKDVLNICAIMYMQLYEYISWVTKPLADPGRHRWRTPPPPTVSNSFVFTYVFAKKCPRRRSAPPQRLGAPQREILDPLLKAAESLLSSLQ